LKVKIKKIVDELEMTFDEHSSYFNISDGEVYTVSDEVMSAAESLDFSCWDVLLQAAMKGEIHPPPMKTMGQALGNARHISAISRLLELRALKTNYLQITPEILAETKDQSAEKLVKYQLTQFGRKNGVKSTIDPWKIKDKMLYVTICRFHLE